MKNTLETRLGLFFALALVVAITILEMVGGADFFKRGYPVIGTFITARELKKGDLVKLAGVEIGRVDEIRLVKSQAQVTVKIQGRYEIRTDARAKINFAGLMGQNFVAIEGGSEAAAKVLTGGTLPPVQQPDLNSLMET